MMMMMKRTTGFSTESLHALPALGRREERGAALVLALLVITALLLLGSGFLATSLTENRVASNEVAAARAFNIAEAGIQRGRIALGATNFNTLLAGGGALYTNQSFDSGSYTVVVSNNLNPPFPLGPIPADAGGSTSDTDGYLILTSTGTFQNAKRRIEVVARQNFISFGSQVVFGHQFINTTSSGDYMAPVGSNGNINPVTQTIHGNATAHGTVSNPGNVTGTVTNGAPLVALPTVNCSGSYGGPALGGNAGVFNSGTGDITFNAAVATQFPSGTYYYHNFAHPGTGALQVAAGATVVIYISGQATLSGFANANLHAANLKIIGCDSDATAWTISNALGVQYLTVYAPTHALTFAGAGGNDFYGGFVGLSITHASGGNIYYDSGVTVGSPNLALILSTWTEKWM